MEPVNLGLDSQKCIFKWWLVVGLGSLFVNGQALEDQTIRLVVSDVHPTMSHSVSVVF